MLGPAYPFLISQSSARGASERTQQCSAAEIQPLAAGLLDQPYIGHRKRRGVGWTAARGGNSTCVLRLRGAARKEERPGRAGGAGTGLQEGELGVRLGRIQRRPVQKFERWRTSCLDEGRDWAAPALVPLFSFQEHTSFYYYTRSIPRALP